VRVEDFYTRGWRGEEGFRGGGQGDVGDYDVAAFAGEELGEGEGDAGAAAGDLVCLSARGEGRKGGGG
jgi:hypothetical protein